MQRGGETMKYIFVDFEMNPINHKNKEIYKCCTQEIIEIGAVMLNEAYQEIDSFKTYVKPEFSKEITRKCVKLTGITTKMLENAPCFHEALLDFVIWCIACEEDFEIYAWSDNDLYQLTQEMALKETEMMEEIQYMLEHWHDFQREFCDLLGLDRPISLKAAVGSIDRAFAGQLHDALWDARNTAYIYSLSKDTKAFNETMRPILELFSPKEDKCMLGDLFDLKALMADIG